MDVKRADFLTKPVRILFLLQSYIKHFLEDVYMAFRILFQT